eukprot:EG_transcript_20430
MTVERALYRSLLRLHRQLGFGLLPHLSHGPAKHALRAAFRRPAESKEERTVELKKGFQALRLVSGAPDPLLAQVLGLWVLALRGLDTGVEQAVVLEDAAMVLAIWNQLLLRRITSDQRAMPRELDALATQVCEAHLEASQTSAGEEPTLLDTLNRVLFEELGFQGNREDYYAPANSLLDAVLERRSGNPITLSVLYIAVARRCGLRMLPIAMPRHVMVFCPAHNAYIDVYHRGRRLAPSEVVQYARKVADPGIMPANLQPAATPAVLQRMVRNLQNSAALQPPELQPTMVAHLAAMAQMLKDWSWPKQR